MTNNTSPPQDRKTVCAAGDAPVSSVKVLLVEDSPSDARLIQLSLTQAGEGRFEVVRAVRLDEALDRLAAEHFDILLLDLGLPDSNGMDTFIRARTAEPRLPIVVLTGDSDEQTGIEAIRRGVQDYLVKTSADGRLVARAIRYAIERSRAEEALRQANEELKRSNMDLEQFAYVASHDLQEPLRMVSSFVQLLSKRYKDKLDDKANEYIHYAVDGAARMQSLIQDLLKYSRAGVSLEPPSQCVSLQTVVDNALHNLKSSLDESGTVITHDVLPALRVDAGQLTQVFQNLIGNAIKFRGDRRPEIHIGARRMQNLATLAVYQETGAGTAAQPAASQSAWLLSVRDNGIGIDPKFADRIFLIFQRLHQRGKYPGTGIGLAICKKIIERQGGRIWVESQPGQGTTFYFTIPE